MSTKKIKMSYSEYIDDLSNSSYQGYIEAIYDSVRNLKKIGVKEDLLVKFIDNATLKDDENDYELNKRLKIFFKVGEQC